MPGVAPSDGVSSEYIAFWGYVRERLSRFNRLMENGAEGGDAKDTRDESALAKVVTDLKGNSKDSLSSVVGRADRSFLPQKLTDER